MILNKYYVQFPRLCINALRVQKAVEGSHSKKSYLCASDAVLLRCAPPSNLCHRTVFLCFVISFILLFLSFPYFPIVS